MSRPAIIVENISKKYQIGIRQRRPDTLSGTLGAWTKALFKGRRCHYSAADSENDNSVPDFIWALRDVSLEVRQGDIIGLIGRNGAGKSTLLKIMSRITEPTHGRVVINGSVASLLEVGTGFHPELTGRENIFLNGTILGMTKQEVKNKFDEIVTFAELDKFVDTPVKHYSSGMYVRLAFAVAAHLEPEILLVDEVLAVGDSAFQKKCLGKMGDVATEGRTILFVSHNMAAIEGLCSRGFLIDSGRIIKDGSIGAVLEEYSQQVLPSIISTPLASREDRSGTGAIRLTGFRLLDAEGKTTRAVRSGHDAIFALDYQARDDNPRSVDVGFGLYSAAGQLLFVLYSSYVGQEFDMIPRHGTFICKVPRLPLSPGVYRVASRVTVRNEEADWPRDGVGYVNVEAGDFYGTGKLGFGNSCPLLISGRWYINEQHIQTTESIPQKDAVPAIM